MKLVGDILLVKKFVPKEVARTSGIILARDTKPSRTLEINEDPTLVQVLAVGEGFYDEETGESVPLDVKPGMLLRVGPTSVYWDKKLPILDYEPGSIGLVSQSAALQIFESEEDFYAFYGQLKV